VSIQHNETLVRWGMTPQHNETLVRRLSSRAGRRSVVGAPMRFLPPLPREAWILLGGVGLSALGNGLTLPFPLVYLNQVRGLELEVAALAVSTRGRRPCG
jgi:hypothetical protein